MRVRVRVRACVRACAWGGRWRTPAVLYYTRVDLPKVAPPLPPPRLIPRAGPALLPRPGGGGRYLSIHAKPGTAAAAAVTPASTSHAGRLPLTRPSCRRASRPEQAWREQARREQTGRWRQV
jgi:hypothetical protein